MAVAHDAASESHTGTTPSTNQDSFNWTHTPTGTPRGVLVYVFAGNNATNPVTGVTYGGSALSAVTSGEASDTADEPGNCKAYFLGASVPTGAQSVVVSRTNNATEMYATAITVTAAADTEYAGVVTESNNQTLAEENIDDGSPGSDSVRYCGLFAGANTIPAAGANTTLLHSITLSFTRHIEVGRETTAGQGARPVGFSDGTTDDVAAVYLAIREAAGGGGGGEGTPVIARIRSWTEAP